MIAQVEKGLADYLTAALAGGPAVVVRPATSSEEVDRSLPLVVAKVTETEFVAGSSSVCLAHIEILVLTLANVGASTATVQGQIEAAVLAAMHRSNLAAIDTAVADAAGWNCTGLYVDAFRDGRDKDQWQPTLPVKLSLVQV